MDLTRSILHEAEKILSKQMALYDYENEFVCIINENTEFIIHPKFNYGDFYGFNLYARLHGECNLILLETYNFKKCARNVIKGIKDGLANGATYYRLPANN